MSIFNEDSLRAAVVSVWGEHGAHVDVLDELIRRARLDAAAQHLHEAGHERAKQRADAVRAMRTDAPTDAPASWSMQQQPQRQDSLDDQLRDLHIAAARLGMYDAADWLWKVAIHPETDDGGRYRVVKTLPPEPPLSKYPDL